MISLLVLAGIGIGLYLILPSVITRSVSLTLVLVLAGLVINFFRDPERTTPTGIGNVISPADGRVVVIKNVHEPEYLQGEAVQVSIFMSPLNVHVNRFPVSGTLEHYRYVPGKYLVAFHEKSSELNERTHLGIRSGGTKIFFKQIAGAIARRIIAPVKVGQPTVAGERFGMIQFGSRVDIFMPRHAVVNVQLDQHVVAGETILATLA